MLDLRLIREDPERVKAAIATTFTEAPIDEIVALDERRRALLTEVESLKAELNQGSKEVGRTKDAERAGDADRRACASSATASAALDEEVKAVDERAAATDAAGAEHPPGARPGRRRTRAAMSSSPSTARSAEFDFTPKPHWELAESSGHHRLRARRQGRRVALLRPARRRRAAATGADHLDARSPHPAARLPGGLSALSGAGGDAGRHRQPAEVRRQSLPGRRKRTSG